MRFSSHIWFKNKLEFAVHGSIPFVKFLQKLLAHCQDVDKRANTPNIRDAGHANRVVI